MECPFCKTEVADEIALYWHVRSYHEKCNAFPSMANPGMFPPMANTGMTTPYKIKCPCCGELCSLNEFADHLGNDRTPQEHIVRMALMQ